LNLEKLFTYYLKNQVIVNPEKVIVNPEKVIVNPEKVIVNRSDSNPHKVSEAP